MNRINLPRPTRTTRTILSLLIGASLSPVCMAATDTGTAISRAEITTPVTSFPSDLVTGANQTQLANYAWRLFIAATQQTTASLLPGGGAGRGVGDGVHSFINTGTTPAVENPLVFESFYHRTEAFPFYTDAKPASPIGQLPTYYTFYKPPAGVTPQPTPGCTPVVPAPKNGRVPCTFSGQSYVNLDETNQIGQNFLYFKNSNAPNFPVLFMAKVNAPEANYAYNWPSANGRPSNTNSFSFPPGVVEVKTAWRRVQDIPGGDQGKYHLSTGTYYVSDETEAPIPHSATFALIAIHIIQKTVNYPQFIFTTFEHVDAVTRNSSNVITDPAYTITYNNLSYQSPSQSPPAVTALGAYSINRANQPAQSNKLSTYTLPAAGQIAPQDQTKVVVQPNTIVREVNDVNNQVNSLIKSVSSNNIWANYRLKGVQAVPTSDTTTSNYYLANIVVESSRPGIQLFSGVLLYGGVGQPGNPDSNNLYFVNCRGQKGSSECIYPEAALNPPAPVVTTYNNVSIRPQSSAAVPPPMHSMGGCQGCHGAAQQAGGDFSFLSSAVLGGGKKIDSVPASSLPAAAKAQHNKRAGQDSKF